MLYFAVRRGEGGKHRKFSICGELKWNYHFLPPSLFFLIFFLTSVRRKQTSFQYNVEVKMYSFNYTEHSRAYWERDDRHGKLSLILQRWNFEWDFPPVFPSFFFDTNGRKNEENVISGKPWGAFFTERVSQIEFHASVWTWGRSTIFTPPSPRVRFLLPHNFPINLIQRFLISLPFLFRQ